MTLDKNVFIAIEGVDASGKSTITQYLSRELRNTCIYSCPPMQFLFLKPMMNEAPAEIRYQYFNVGNYAAGKEIERQLTFNHVICTWYAHSTAAFHSVLMGKELEVPEGIFLPDLIVHTDAPIDVIDQRLSEREHRTPYEEIEFLAKVQKEYARLFEGLDNVIRVDTTTVEPQQNAKRIISELRHRI
jgi:thymidylate kinase